MDGLLKNLANFLANRPDFRLKSVCITIEFAMALWQWSKGFKLSRKHWWESPLQTQSHNKFFENLNFTCLGLQKNELVR